MQLRIWKKSEKDNLHRHNYVDPSQRFQDWVSQLGIEKTWWGRTLQYLEQKFKVSRLLFIFAFSFFLSLLIFYRIEIPMKLDIGQPVKFDLLSPFAFEMVDETSTEDHRIRAEAVVPVVLDYDSQVFERTAANVYKSFKLMRVQFQEVPWSSKAVEHQAQLRKFIEKQRMEFEKELGAPIADHIFGWLSENGFAPKYEDAVIQILEKVSDQKVMDDVESSVPIYQNEVSVRMIQKNGVGKEFNLAKSQIQKLATIQKNTDYPSMALTEKLNDKEKLQVLSIARALMAPNLKVNLVETESRKQRARESVIPVTLAIKKGQLIVGKGQVIQPFHMAIINQIETIKSERRRDFVALSLAIFLAASALVFFSYIRRFTINKVKVDFKDTLVMMAISFFVIFMVKFYLFVADAAFVSRFADILPSSFFLYSAPVATGPMLVGLLIVSGEVVWLFTAFLAICLGVMEDFNFVYALVCLVGGIAAARGVFSCKTRNELYFAGLRTGIVNAAIVFALTLISRFDQELLISELVMSVLGGFIGGILSSFMAMMLIPFLETVFNYTTDVKLLELSNLNHPLLKEMIVRAPGTYHHSMMVGSMVEAAAEEIGANSLLGKVMCYYHDIGKMLHPNYFIENQKPNQNPHDSISPFMSKTLLIAHVKDGVELGIEHKLGKPIIDGIVQHHGTTLISYFYNKSLDQRSEGDPEFDDAEFRYPGPKPQFSEAALCMLADSIEAAARSLDEPTPMRLQNIVKNVIQRKFMDGQLDECNLTLKDISKVETAFVRILIGVYHQRIDYPRAAGGGLGDASPNR